MKILVTGANGFVGRQLVPALAAYGHEVRAASRIAFRCDGVEHVFLPALEADINWVPLVRGVNAIVHLAGVAHASKAVSDGVYEQVNHRATVALARAAEEASLERFVFVSSIRAQSGPTYAGVLTEVTPPSPSDAYGRSKLAAERALSATALPYSILRPVLIYGPGLKGNLAQLARLARLPIPLPFAAFTNRRSLLGIANLITAVQHVLTSQAASRQTFVVSDPTPTTLAEILACFRRGAGRSPWLVSVPQQILFPVIMVAGGRAMWNRLTGDLVVNPMKLVASGWEPVETRHGLERLCRSLEIV